MRDGGRPHRVPADDGFDVTAGRRQMRTSSVASEAWRNLASGTSRPLLLALLAALLLGGLAAADIRTIVGFSAQAVAFREAGAAVRVLSAPAAISGQRCDALRQLPGVLGSGATRLATAQAEVLTAPRAGIPTIEATPGLRDVLGVASGASSGVWLSDAAAESLGAWPGTTLPTSRGPARVAAQYSYPPDASDRSLAYAIVAPIPATGYFDSCWVLVWPPSVALDPLIRGTYAGDPADQSAATLVQLNTRLGATLDGPELLASRATSHAPTLAAAIGLLLGAGAIRLRRLELAGALHARVPKVALLTQIWFELTAVAAAAALLALPAAYWLASHGNPDPPWPAWFAGLRVIGAGTLSTTIGGLVATASTSENRLFRYFKER